MKTLRRAAFAVACLLSLCILTFGQGVGGNGSVTGRITDPSGAVIPGATIALVDKATNVKTSAESNSAGLYFIENVPGGTYDLLVTREGFRKTIIPAQTVSTGAQLTLDIKLEVGATTETVEVMAVAGAELQTENATMGTTMGNEAVMQLPTIGRDVSALVFLQGTTAPTFNGAEGNITSGNIAGAMADQNTFMLDGGNNTSDLDGDNATYVGHNGAGVMPTPVESVEEFRVNTNNMSADFSMSGGGQIMVTTKRGTSQYHGSAYDFLQDSAFAANDYYNNFAGITKPQSVYNKYGGSIGGPIGKLNFLGGGWYFFANYEGEQYPRSGPFTALVPSQTLRQGIVQERDANGNIVQYNLKTGSICGNGTQMCDPLGIGLNPIVNQIWSKYEPACNTQAFGDHGLNTCGYTSNLTYPLSNNFGVFRLDHDFGSKNRFFASYRYFGQSSPTTDQVDIGGLLPGDKLGQPASASNDVNEPRYFVAGLTSTISPTTTNDFHFSYLRNSWNWLRAGAYQQNPGTAAGIEIGGEVNATSGLQPLNEDAQNSRARTWQGHDYDYRDNISALKGTHLLQVGGEFFYQWWHFDRYDSVGTLVEPTMRIQSGGIYFDPSTLPVPCTATLTAGCLPSGSLSNYESLYAQVLGLVANDAVVATRTGSNLSLQPPGTPVKSYVRDNTYSIYFSDSWKIKPNLTLNYGLNYTIQTPPWDLNGTQDTLVNAQNQLVTTQSYLAARLSAAENGQVYNPVLGFSPVGVAGNNGNNSTKYPYSPFYGGVQPRVAIAWSPESKGDGWLSKLLGNKATVIRAGYGRSYSRNLGIDLVSTPVLGDSFLQTVVCNNPNASGTCTSPSGTTPATAYRIGVDGNGAPFPSNPNTLPSPVLPGVNAPSSNVFGLDRNFRPGQTDSYDISIQRQFKGNVIVEASYVGNMSRHLFQGIDLNDVPWMTKLNGQTFAQAYDNLYFAQKAGHPPAPQPFLEAALKGSAYCQGFVNCTQAVATNEAGNVSTQAVTNLWQDLDTSFTAFGPALLSTNQCSICYMDTSTGKSNYNALVLSVQKRSSHGLTVNGNFTYGKSLGTIAINQAYTENNVNNPWNLNYDYGPQFWDRKFVFNLLATYQLPFGKGQKFDPHNRWVDMVVGGWNISPIFSLGSGLPLDVYTGSYQELGNGYDGNGCAAVPTSSMSYSNSPTLNITSNGVIGVNGDQNNGGYGANLFGNNVANVYNNFRPFLVGIDSSCGGGGQLRGQMRWNLDLGLTKNTRINDRVGFQIYAQAFNVFNHMMYSDPYLNLQDPADFGALEGQYNALALGGAGASPNYTRIIQLGLRIYF